MRHWRQWMVVSLVLCFSSVSALWAANASAQADERADDRKALLQVFDEIVKGINEQNIERMTAQMDENATVIWLNAEASRGHADIKAYYRRMVSMDGRADAILKKYTDRKSTRLNSSHVSESRMPSSA